MIRILIAMLAVTATLAMSPAAPEPVHLMPKPKPIYFPTEVGTKWVWESAQTEIAFEIVEANSVKGGKQVIVAQGIVAERSARNEYFVSEDGVGMLGYAPIRLAEPYWIFRSDPRGGKWQWTSPFIIPKVIEAEGTFKAVGMEKITVPAGTFEAIRVEMKITLPTNDETTTWFAPGIGKIREDWKGRSEVLKSFVRGGKKPTPPVRIGR